MDKSVMKNLSKTEGVLTRCDINCVYYLIYVGLYKNSTA